MEDTTSITPVAELKTGVRANLDILKIPIQVGVLPQHSHEEVSVKKSEIQEDTPIAYAYPVVDLATHTNTRNEDWPHRLKRGETVMKGKEMSTNSEYQKELVMDKEPSAPPLLGTEEDDTSFLEVKRTHSQEAREIRKAALESKKQAELQAKQQTLNETVEAWDAERNKAYQEIIDLCTPQGENEPNPDHEAIPYYEKAGQLFKEAIACLKSGETTKAEILHFQGQFTFEMGQQTEKPQCFQVNSSMLNLLDWSRRAASFCEGVLDLKSNLFKTEQTLQFIQSVRDLYVYLSDYNKIAPKDKFFHYNSFPGNKPLQYLVLEKKPCERAYKAIVDFHRYEQQLEKAKKQEGTTCTIS